MMFLKRLNLSYKLKREYCWVTYNKESSLINLKYNLDTKEAYFKIQISTILELLNNRKCK